MTTRLSKLALAAALAAALPALAAANEPGRPCDHDHDRDLDGRPAVVTPVYTPAPPPAYAPPAYAPPAYPPPAYAPYRAARGPELRWRDRELASIHAELRALDAQRSDFYAYNAYRPGKLRRFDRWYFARRADLERREHQLERVAWR